MAAIGDDILALGGQGNDFTIPSLILDHLSRSETVEGTFDGGGGGGGEGIAGEYGAGGSVEQGVQNRTCHVGHDDYPGRGKESYLVRDIRGELSGQSSLLLMTLFGFLIRAAGGARDAVP